MPLLNLPNELLLLISSFLPQTSLYSFLRSNRFFATLLTPPLHAFASTPKEGIPALLWAARGGFTSLVRILLTHPAPNFNINIRDSRGQTALHIASYAGNTPIVRLLLELSTDLNINAVSHMRNSALHLATSYSSRCYTSSPIVALLLSHGIDPTLKNSEGETALYQAAAYGYIPAMKHLLSHSLTGIEARNSFGETPLHRAACGGQVDAIRVLLENGADVNVRNRRGMTPLHHAVVYQPGVETVQVLLDGGADIDAGDYAGRTPLHLAARKRYAKMARMLLDNGADREAKTEEGTTVVAMAQGAGAAEIVRMLEGEGGGKVVAVQDGGEGEGCL